MSNVIEFPLIPLWNPNLNVEGLSEYVLNKTNIKEWISYLQNNYDQYNQSETENDGYGHNEMLEDIRKTIDEIGFVVMGIQKIN